MNEECVISFDPCEYESPGSYVIVKLCGIEGKTCTGEIVFNNPNKKYKIGDIVLFYHDDSKIVNINNEQYYVIPHYYIILKKFIIDEKNEKTLQKWNFNKLDAYF